MVERTILLLKNTQQNSQTHLKELLDHEQNIRTVPSNTLWLNLGKIAAAAAALIILVPLFNASLNYIHYNTSKQRCQSHLARIFNGLINYTNDYEGNMPSVATSMGAPWWKIGDQGKENQSNTRNAWLLVKGNYASPQDFVCPGKKQSKLAPCDCTKNDFPSREYVIYSLRLKCNKTLENCLSGSKVIMADLNPIFEELPHNFSQSFKRELNEELLTRNSINHNKST